MVDNTVRTPGVDIDVLLQRCKEQVWNDLSDQSADLVDQLRGVRPRCHDDQARGDGVRMSDPSPEYERLTHRMNNILAAMSGDWHTYYGTILFVQRLRSKRTAVVEECEEPSSVRHLQRQ